MSASVPPRVKLLMLLAWSMHVTQRVSLQGKSPIRAKLGDENKYVYNKEVLRASFLHSCACRKSL